MNKAAVLKMTIFMMASALSLSFISGACAEGLYGCPKDELLTLKSGKCPVCGEDFTEAREGYIYDGKQNRLDTISQKEKDDLAIKGDSAFYVVIYRSPLGEASFTPGNDRKGNILEKQLVKLQYDCDGVLSVKSMSDKCRILGDTPESLAKERDDDAIKDKQNKIESDAKLEKERVEASKRANIKILTEDSWPMFYKKEKDAGKTDEQVQALWGEVVKGVYDKYGYDPETDTFFDYETQNAGGEK